MGYLLWLIYIFVASELSVFPSYSTGWGDSKTHKKRDTGSGYIMLIFTFPFNPRKFNPKDIEGAPNFHIVDSLSLGNTCHIWQVEKVPFNLPRLAG